MLDINIIREKPEWVKEQIAKLNDSAPIDEILAADARRREILQEVEELRRQRNESSKQIGRWMGSLKKMQADLQTGRGRTGCRPAAQTCCAPRLPVCKPTPKRPRRRPADWRPHRRIG